MYVRPTRETVMAFSHPTVADPRDLPSALPLPANRRQRSAYCSVHCFWLRKTLAARRPSSILQTYARKSHHKFKRPSFRHQYCAHASPTHQHMCVCVSGGRTRQQQSMQGKPTTHTQTHTQKRATKYAELSLSLSLGVLAKTGVVQFSAHAVTCRSADLIVLHILVQWCAENSVFLKCYSHFDLFRCCFSKNG